MKFYSLTDATIEQQELQTDYQSAHEVGIMRLGNASLFFRKKFRIYYVPYQQITRCYRRVMLVPARMCCGKGDLAIENLVIHDQTGELAQIQLPGTKAAKLVMEELKEKLPHADFSCPEQKEADPES